jgi:hypothetical protein
VENYAEISGLLLKHLRSELTQEERAVIDAWVAQSEQNRQFFDYINNTQALLADVQAVEEAKDLDVEKALDRVKEQTREKPAISPQRPVIQMKR